ncbi:hypothetical protein BHC43_03245 [Snodgrassella alvi]|nr:hypothetical protein BHC43_03330 [Snodgrassella alvi]PIT39772.1 hypothetical protein BHC43_03245 [Snodgrassella alvi]
MRSNASIFNKLESRNQQTKIEAWKLSLETDEVEVLKELGDDCIAEQRRQKALFRQPRSKLYESRELKS